MQKIHMIIADQVSFSNVPYYDWIISTLYCDFLSLLLSALEGASNTSEHNLRAEESIENRLF